MDVVNKTQKLIKRCAFTAGGLYIFNRVYSMYSVRHHILKAEAENYYPWKDLKVYYNKKGSGSPVILLHSLNPVSSSFEWNLIEDDLAKNHTVYTIDLPGCGRSDKPKLHYANFLYVSLLKDFIISMELESPTIVTSNLSASIAVMTAAYESKLIGKIVLINPPSIQELTKTPTLYSRFLMGMINSPLIGTFIYNLIASRSQIDLALTEKYLYNPFHDNDELLNVLFESSQLGYGKGHYLASSLLGRYLNIDVRYAVSNTSVPIKLIEGNSTVGADETVFEWRSVQKKISTVRIDQTKNLPHLEEPKAVVAEIEKFIDDET